MIAGPLGDSVVLSITIVASVLEAAVAVIVLSPTVKVACESAAAVITTSNSDMKTVCAPCTTSPAVLALICEPSTVMAEPPTDKVVPLSTMALPLPQPDSAI